MHKLSLLLVLLLAFVAIPSSSFAAVTMSKPAAKKPMMKKMMKKGITTAQAKEVQSMLAKDGLYKGKADGMIGPMTVKAVKAFQKKNGLKADGIIGPKTLKALGIK